MKHLGKRFFFSKKLTRYQIPQKTQTHQEYGQQPVEEVVGREHLDDLRRLDGGAVQDPRGVHAQPAEGVDSDFGAGFVGQNHIEGHAYLVTIQVIEKQAKRASHVRW